MTAENQHETMTRREVADFVGVHVDTITRLLTEGLGCAVARWGGHSKRMAFSRDLVVRWNDARLCKRGPGGGPCAKCTDVLEDCIYTAEHLMKARHGHGGCEECTAPWLLGKPRIQHGPRDMARARSLTHEGD